MGDKKIKKVFDVMGKSEKLGEEELKLILQEKPFTTEISVGRSKNLLNEAWGAEAEKKFLIVDSEKTKV